MKEKAEVEEAEAKEAEEEAEEEEHSPTGSWSELVDWTAAKEAKGSLRGELACR